MIDILLFQSTRPMRGGTVPMSLTLLLWAFQSTRPVRGGTKRPTITNGIASISIHPPRAGRDRYTLSSAWRRSWDFNPPAPCGAGQFVVNVLGGVLDFNPPAPCGAGRGYNEFKLIKQNFNPPAPCGAGHEYFGIVKRPSTISIHPPRAGRD